MIDTPCVYRPLELQLIYAGDFLVVLVVFLLVAGVVRRFRRSPASTPVVVRWMHRLSTLLAVILCIWAGLYFADETRRGVATWKTAAKIELHRTLGPGLLLLALTATSTAVWHRQRRSGFSPTGTG